MRSRLAAKGQLTVEHVRTGVTDGQMTQVSGPDVQAGMQVIAGIASSGPDEAVSNPFQSNGGSRRRGRF